jgi:hypothetical protein
MVSQQASVVDAPREDQDDYAYPIVVPQLGSKPAFEGLSVPSVRLALHHERRPVPVDHPVPGPQRVPTWQEHFPTHSKRRPQDRLGSCREAELRRVAHRVAGRKVAEGALQPECPAGAAQLHDIRPRELIALEPSPLALRHAGCAGRGRLADAGSEARGAQLGPDRSRLASGICESKVGSADTSGHP